MNANRRRNSPCASRRASLAANRRRDARLRRNEELRLQQLHQARHFRWLRGDLHPVAAALGHHRVRRTSADHVEAARRHAPASAVRGTPTQPPARSHDVVRISAPDLEPGHTQRRREVLRRRPQVDDLDARHQRRRRGGLPAREGQDDHGSTPMPASRSISRDLRRRSRSRRPAGVDVDAIGLRCNSGRTSMQASAHPSAFTPSTASSPMPASARASASPARPRMSRNTSRSAAAFRWTASHEGLARSPPDRSGPVSRRRASPVSAPAHGSLSCDSFLLFFDKD